MKVVLDTNILVSALMSKSGASHQIYQAWRDKRVTLLTCAEQLVEVREVTRRVAVALRITPAEAGRMLNSLRMLAVVLDDLPDVQRSNDPKDNYILALAQAGDKSGQLALRRHAAAEIVAAGVFFKRCLA